MATPGAEELLGATPAEAAARDGGPARRALQGAAGAPDPGEDPSWLAPPSRLKRVMRVLLVLLLLIVIAGGALLAYLLTR